MFMSDNIRINYLQELELGDLDPYSGDCLAAWKLNIIYCLE